MDNSLEVKEINENNENLIVDSKLTKFDYFIGTLQLINVIIQNLYVIPIYLITNWFFLLPIYYLSPNLYWTIENYLYNWSLYIVSSWPASLGFKVYENGDDILSLTVNDAKQDNGLKINDKSLTDNESNVSVLNRSLSSTSDKNFTKTANYSPTIGVKKEPRILVISNHQSTADVPLMMTAFTSHSKYRLLWIIDAVFKYTNFGVVSYTHQDYFINLRKYIKNDVCKYCMQRKRNNCVLLFPEGGFRYKKLKSSNEFAIKNNLPKLENVVWPRFGAFEDLIENNQLEFTHIVDLTIIYPDIDNALSIIDIAVKYFSSFVKSNEEKNKKIHFVYRVFNINDCKFNGDWLNEIWKEKEQLINLYYKSYDHFIDKYKQIRIVEINFIKVLAIHMFYIILSIIYYNLFKYLISFIF